MTQPPKCRCDSNHSGWPFEKRCSECDVLDDQPLVLPGHSKLSSDLLDLYASKANADVTFVCSDGKIKAHKLILVSRVPHFETIFSAVKGPGRKRKKPSTHQVKVPGAKKDSFDVFLRFIYGGQLPDDFDVEQQLKFAKEYGISSLVPHCIPKLQQVIKTFLKSWDEAERFIKAYPFPEVRNSFEQYMIRRICSHQKLFTSSTLKDKRKVWCVDMLVGGLQFSHDLCLPSLKKTCVEIFGWVFGRWSVDLLEPAIKDLEEYPDLLVEMLSHYRVY